MEMNWTFSNNSSSHDTRELVAGVGLSWRGEVFKYPGKKTTYSPLSRLYFIAVIKRYNPPDTFFFFFLFSFFMNSGVRSRLLWRDEIPGNSVAERITVEVWMGGQTSKDKSKTAWNL